MDNTDINNFKELQQATIDFLNKNLCELPTHSAPVEDETEIIKKDLVKINELGLLTICSEPFIYYFGNGIKYRQRPFVCVIIQQKIFGQFISKLEEMNKNVTAIASYLNNGEYSVHGRMDYGKLKKSEGILYMTMHQAKINGKWVEDPAQYTTMSFCYDDMQMCYSPELQKELKENYLYVNIYSDEFNNKLFEDIIKCVEF